MTPITWSSADICNLALSELGESLEITALTDTTAAAKACNRFYDLCRQRTLRDAPWPFATKYAVLTQLTTFILPTSEYQFQYNYPADALVVRGLLNGVSRIEDKQSRIPYRIAQAQTGTTKVILCDVEPITGNTDTTQNVPWVRYTVDVTDTTQFTPEFVEAVAFLLAWRIGPRIAGDKSKLIDNAGMLYTSAIIQAKRAALNEQAQDDEPLSEFERAREGWPPAADLLELP